MDKFKKYLQQREREMNVDAPSHVLWENIRQKTTARQSKTVLFIRRYAVAAAVLILVSAGIIIITKSGKNNPGPGNIAGTTEIPKKESATEPAKTNDTAKASGKDDVIPSAGQKKPTRFLATTDKRKKKKDLTVAGDITMIGDGYARLIDYQVRKLRTTPVYAEQPGYFSRFGIQLKQMDADELGVKNDIHTYGLNDKLLEQLINVYQQKLNLLKSLQQEINKMNNRVKENEAPSDTLKPYFLHL